MLTTDTTPSAKLDRLEDLVENITAQGDKVVVFCTFKGTIPELTERLKKYNPLVCTGDVSDDDINKNKDKFEKEDKHKVMVCTWQKMGTGHTMTSANYAIFVYTPWTDADFQQCSDRIYRIGQSKPVFIITLITKDTYDERVQEILDRKEMLSGYLVDKRDCELTQMIDYE
jgi:SNF2 family DNA or RNA helicase